LTLVHLRRRKYEDFLLVGPRSEHPQPGTHDKALAEPWVARFEAMRAGEAGVSQ
jgi:hypothetical protein